LLKVKYANIINLLADKEIIPEYLQENCTVQKLHQGLLSLWEHRTEQLAETPKYLSQLQAQQNRSASQEAAGVVLSFYKT
jgi:lipid-A-disaccharide synthase